MKFAVVFSVMFAIFAELLTHELAPILEIEGGKIQGQVLYTRVEPFVKYLSYKGIPYAAPPIGDLRFKPPQPVQSWEGVRHVQVFGEKCPQWSSDRQSVEGSEDCLTLNVYSKQDTENPTELMSVIFFVHGGAFSSLGSYKYGPDFLIPHDIVLVTINYRLGVLGFLTVNDESAYGNMGLKDQLAALKWVNRNIEKFGGDPNRVTIAGLSAGAMSVDYLLFAASSSDAVGVGRNLVHQTIQQSGSGLTKIALQRTPFKYLRALLAHFDIQTNSSKEIVQKLQETDYVILVQAAQNFSMMDYTRYTDAQAFAPVIEVENVDAIVTKSSYRILEEGSYEKVPFLTGFNTGDGSFGLLRIEKFSTIQTYDEHPELYASPSLNLESEDEAKEVGRVIKNYYLGESSANNSVNFLRFLTYDNFALSIRKMVDFKRQFVDGYYYRFSYEGIYTGNYPGATHAKEAQYIFYIDEFDQESLNEDDILTRERVSKMWANFAKTGSPTPDVNDSLLGVQWPKVDKKEIGFLDIGKDLVPGVQPNETEYQFFEDIFDQYGHKPFVTY